QQAEDAATLVDADYAELPHVLDEVRAGQPGAPLVHDAWPDNNCGRWRLRHGDIERGLAESDRVYHAVYRSPPASHVPMEPHVCVAQWTGDGLTVWTSAQAPHAVRQGLERMFRLDPGDVRVLTLNLGGAYGGKGQVKIEPMTACAARAVGRPVRIELARDEVFQTVGKHAATVEITTGVRADGTLLARRMRVTYNAGAYAVTSPGAAGQGLTRAPGPYAIEHCAVDSVANYTNTVPSGPFRGAMTSQLAFAYESQMDDIAGDLGIDPLEFRRRNLLRDGGRYATGEVMSGLHYDELLDDLDSALDWGTPVADRGPRLARGRGVAVMLKNTLTPSRSEARLELGRDGRVTIYSSSVEMGQGVGASMLQLTAGYLGVDADRLDMVLPDTACTPFDTTTSSSRSTYSMGYALERAAEHLLARLAELAAARFRAEPATMAHHRGRTGPRGRPGDALPWARLMAEAGVERVVGEGVFASDFGLRYLDPADVRGPVTVHWHQGAAGAEVEVDLDTGQVRVLRMHASCYAGRVVSPTRVRQQNVGCAIYGLGPTLFEEVRYSDGVISNPNLSDYMIPSIVDVPEWISSSAIEGHGPDVEIHGIGEMALPAVAPAVANAVFAATGARIHELPLTPERVLDALDRRREPTR
ncbi:MAG TPA: molybdopterin cofactor-binding domain-containing protein, partial [Mycobacteriales bacterium]|nr:molybdopterin cofactor-binding domain-containing protein [Mycobacteriales bacterium]